MTEDAPEGAGDTDKEARTSAEFARKWVAEIHAAEKAQNKWLERAKKVEKIYNDERDLSTGRARKFNILWSNVETLRPAVYMQTPKAQAVRRYRDRDPVARLASMLLERSLQTSCELYDFDHCMDQVVRDRLVAGRGQAWIFYEPEIAGDGEAADVAYHKVVADYVPWKDFLHSTANTWSEVRWVARRFRKSRGELKAWLIERGLNPKIAATIKLDYKADGKDEKDERSQAQIWEVWDKQHGEVLYVAPSSGEQAILGREPPKVQYRDFFPCPRPMLATITSDSLIPTPDYALYQDQAEELNRLTDRIGVLQKALKVAGVYASESTELADLLGEGSENKMIAVKNWAMFAEGGGVKGRIEWFPVEQVGMVLTQLYQIREQAKQTLYEVSGIGDILRGATDPDETATAQGIKAKWGSLRVRRVQKDTQRFAADIMRLKAEVMAEQFPFQSLLGMAGFDQTTLEKYLPTPPAPQMPPPDPNTPPEVAQQMQQQAQMMADQERKQAAAMFLAEVEKLLRDDTARSFRIDVETDSMLEPDEAEEKQARTEFVQTMAMFMEKAAPMAMASPESAKLVGELMQFAVRGFKKADSLEQTIEAAVEAMQKQAAQPRPNPEAEKMKAEAEAKKGELALKGQEVQAKAAESQSKLQLEGQKLQLEKALAVVDAKIKAKELMLKEREIGIKEKDLDLRGREISDRGAFERERLEDGKSARKEALNAERRKGMTVEEEDDDIAVEEGRPTKNDVLAEALVKLASAMERPKRLVRGPDGRAVGVE